VRWRIAWAQSFRRAGFLAVMPELGTHSEDIRCCRQTAPTPVLCRYEVHPVFFSPASDGNLMLMNHRTLSSFAGDPDAEFILLCVDEDDTNDEMPSGENAPVPDHRRNHIHSYDAIAPRAPDQGGRLVGARGQEKGMGIKRCQVGGGGADFEVYARFTHAKTNKKRRRPLDPRWPQQV